MGRPRKIAVDLENSPLDDGVENIGNLREVDTADLTSEEQDVLQAVLELEGGSDAKWQVTRIAPLAPGKFAGYCDTFASVELSKEEIRTRLGRGRYRVRGFKATGGFLKQVTIDIASDPPQVTPKDEVRSVLDTLTEREERRSERTREMLMALAPVGATIVTAILSRQQPQQNLLGDLATLKVLLKEDRQPETASTTIMEAMFKAMEFASKAGGKSGESNWVDLAKEAMGALVPILESRLSQGAQPQGPASGATRVAVSQVAPSIPVGVSAVSAAPLASGIESPGQSVNGENDMLKLLSWARETLGYLVTKAAKASDPDLYVDWLLDNVPDGVDVLQFVKYLNEPNWWEIVQQFQPAVAPYHGWFHQFRDLLIDACADDGPDATSDGADAASNETDSL